MSPGTPTTIVSAVTRSSSARAARRVGADGAAVDRLAEQQERLHREALGEAPAVMLEILGHRRPIEPGLELAEARVELVAAAVGEHARAGGRGSCRWRRRRCGCRRAPARAAGGASPCPSRRAAGPAEMAIEPAAAFGMAHGEGDADHAAQAGADEGDRRRAAAAVEPRRHQVGEPEHRDRRRRPGLVEAAPGRSVARPARTEHRHAGRVDEVGAKSAGHHGSLPPWASPWPSPSGNGEAVMPPTTTTTGAVPSSGP